MARAPTKTGGSATLSVTDNSRRSGRRSSNRALCGEGPQVNSGRTIKNPDGDDGSSRRNDLAAVGLNPGSVVRGSDEWRGENVPDRAWRAARSRRNLVHGTDCHLAGTA